LKKALAGQESPAVRVINRGDRDYPALLGNIYDPPPVLYVKGKLNPEEKRMIAIVGARKATPYGLAVAEKLGRELAGRGFCIVSGMARGIDSAAHRGALAGGGQTIAVLGCGLNVVYPRENRRLMEEIAANGAVISEFPLDSPPESWHFPKRNRVISGLSLGVVVVEAAEKSGTSITVNFALEQGREVFAVPGPVTGKLSRGPHSLIKNGAKLVENVDDIMEELGFSTVTPKNSGRDAHLFTGLSDAEMKLFRLLSLEPVQSDELVRRSGLTGQEVVASLLGMEIRGLVKKLPGQKYVLVGC
jgi:DNA processing protein